jgi:L-ascorbate metabolism protein UlaG (beta-lactamase superfamily)
MLRCLVVVAACLLVGPVCWSQDKQDKADQKEKKKDEKKAEKKPGIPGKITVSWHGQSFFSVVTTRGTVFVFDPHAIPQYGPPTSDLNPDVIFLSHNHNDHTRTEIFENVREKADKAPKIINGLKSDGGREAWNLSEETYKDLTIKILGGYHDDVKGMKHGLTGIFIVDVDGWRIVHLGDLGHRLTPKQLKTLGDVDVLMVPCGGIYGLNGADAQVVVKDIKPKEFILPMHIGTSRYDDLLPVDEFIDENIYKCALIRDGVFVYSPGPRSNVNWLRMNTKESDNTIVLERDANRKGPIIVNLHYWPQTKKTKK